MDLCILPAQHVGYTTLIITTFLLYTKSLSAIL